MYNRITNPLQRRRIKLGYSQTKMSELLNITQSQYSRIEKGDSDPTKHIKKLSEIFKCKPNEVFMGDILREMEDEFLSIQHKEVGCQYHEKKPESVYLEIKGWFTKSEVKKNLEFIMDGLEIKK